MITEIINFVNDLPEDVHSYQLRLEDGLYLELDISEGEKPVLVNSEMYRESRETQDVSPFLEKCLRLQTVTKHEFQVNKCFNSTEKIFIQTASPFALGFKKEAIEQKIGDRAKLQKAIESYFKRAKDFLEDDNEQHIVWYEQFRSFCKNGLLDWVREQEAYKDAKGKTVIRIFFAPPAFEDFKATYDLYISANALNEPVNGYGYSEMLSKFPSKKVFMQHKSAPFELNFKLQGEEAKTIWQFYQLQKRKVLPNPLPIFIDKRELNGKVIGILREEKSISYSQILKRVFDEPAVKGDLGNYYLLFIRKGDIVDLDFVPAFQYDLDIRIERLFKSKKEEEEGTPDVTVKNVFEFESRIANKIFDGQLVVEKTNWLKYFDDIDYDPKYMSHNTFNQLLKHRKAFYDFVYKSRREAIQSHAFHDIMVSSILDLIHRDKELENTNAIKEKLNIWFSLYGYFNTSRLNLSDMVNKTKNMVTRMQEIVREGGEEAFHDDDEFAFASGQLIRNLLSQNESASRTHALLEPFLQKVDPGLFKLAIARAFDTYKHALKFYKGSERYSFDKIMSMVMGAEPSNNNMKDHLPMILAGYFAKPVFYTDKQAVN